MNKASEHILVEQYVDVIGGSVGTEQVLCDGGRITAVTTPGCWGPMSTPEITGGHEVTSPVYLQGAAPGDSVAIFVESVEPISEFCSTGTSRPIAGRFENDPSVKAVCPHCGTVHPKTYLSGIGEDAVRCAACGEPILPQTFENGYTVACSPQERIAVAVAPAGAAAIAEMTSRGEVFLPKASREHLATILGRADFSGLPIRCRPMVGNVGCVPAVPIPSSKNTGDFAASLGKTDLFAVPRPEQITDAHMDINLVGQGSVVLSPVLVAGAGIYLGDVHLTQGCGEIAGHTLDICAKVTVRVKLLKGAALPGPVLLPAASELDSRFLPFTESEYAGAQKLYQRFLGGELPRSYPIQVVGTGAGMDAAFENALQRAVQLTGLPLGEIKNRATTGGGIGIGRTSGCVYLTLMLEEATLQKAGLLALAQAHYAQQ